MDKQHWNASLQQGLNELPSMRSKNRDEKKRRENNSYKKTTLRTMLQQHLEFFLLKTAFKKECVGVTNFKWDIDSEMRYKSYGIG